MSLWNSVPWLGVLAVLVAVFIFITLYLWSQLKQLQKKYRQYMRGENGVSLERKLSVEVRELREMTGKISSMVSEMESLSHVQTGALQHIGLVRYNPFPESGQHESFSLTLVDGKGSGITLTSLANRNESHLYIKPVREGRFIVRASREEEESLTQAMHRVAIGEKTE